jgi:putative oxidoreductase
MTRDRAIDLTYFLLRVVAGLMFMQAGGQKLLGWFGGVPAAMGGPPAAMTQVWYGAWMELIGGALIILGLFTRPVAFLLAGEMAVAYWQFHYGGGKAPWEAPWTWPAQNGGAPAVLYCFIFLFMAAYGAGRWSLDAAIFGKAKTAKPEPA